MQKLTRIYVGNYGYASAWYDGITFDLTDPATGLPSNTIINLENGGGKTSLLGFIFSCFDTSIDRFLQTIQDKKARFSEYFSKDGLPGVALLEWVLPPRTAGGVPCRVVVGQVVAYKQPVEKDELDRIFFAFEVGNGLELESVPVPKLNLSPANNLADFSRWLIQSQKDHANFFWTRGQSDWQRHLRDERNIDVDMLKMQVNFSAQEGGMDAGFLTFGSEAEFLQKFFFLTVDAERAEAVRSAVVSACDKLRKKPFFEKRLMQLTQLQSTLQHFAQAATNYANAREEQKAATNSGGGLVLSLTARAQQKDREAVESRDFAAARDDVSAESLKAAENHRDDHVRWLGAQHAWELQTAQVGLSNAKAGKDAAARTLNLTKAARLQAEIAACSRQIEELDATAATAEEGLTPIYDRAKVQGALLRRALVVQETSFRDKSKTAVAQSLARNQDIITTKAQIKEVDASSQQAEKERTRLQDAEQKYLREKSSLLQRAMLEGPDESAVDGAARCATQSQTLTSESGRLREQHAHLLATQRELKAHAKIAATEAQKLSSERDKALVYLGAAEAEREALSQLSILRQTAQADIADPDSPALRASLDLVIKSAEREIASSNVRIAEARSSRQAIEETGVAGLNPDVTEVVSALRAAGIKSARAFNTYIAQALPDVDRARALVDSNPGRFLGVAVAASEFDKAQELTLAGLRLSRPVVVSLTALEPGLKHENSFVVSASDDSGFNQQAARNFADSLDKRIDDEQQRLATSTNHLKAAISAKERIGRYLEGFSTVAVVAAKTSIFQLKGELAATLARVSETELKEIECETAAREKLEQAQQKTLQSTGLEAKRQELARFAAEYEDGRGIRVSRIEELRQFLVEQAEVKTGLEGLVQSGESEVQELFQARVRLESQADELGRERGALKHYDKAYPAEDELVRAPRDLATLRLVYKDAAETYDTEARNRLGVLHEKTTAAKNTKKEKTDTFTRKFPGVTTADLRPYAQLDFDVATADAEAAVVITGEQTSLCEKSLGAAEANANRFRDAYSGATLALPAEGSWDLPSLRAKAEEMLALHQQSTEQAKVAKDEANQAFSRARLAQHDAKASANLARTLRTTLALPELPDHEPVPLSSDLDTQVNEVVKAFTASRGVVENARTAATRSFNTVKTAAASSALHDVEPEVASQLMQNEFEAACLDSTRILEGLVDRISTTQTNLDSLLSDFDACVEELYNLSLQGIALLHSATTNKKVPDDAPYVGGKAVLKMRANFTNIAPDVKRAHLRAYLDSIIDTHIVPSKGADLVAESVLRLHGKPLGLQILKMVVDESLQYVAVDRIHNSGGEGMVMAMFLYLVINQIRSESMAKLHKAGGGPLILDNPFAKATTPALWKAQRLLAKAMDVQLIFATAVADYNTVGEFQRFIRLRNIGKNSKTGRSHLEAADFKLRDEVAA